MNGVGLHLLMFPEAFDYQLRSHASKNPRKFATRMTWLENEANICRNVTELLNINSIFQAVTKISH